MTQKVVAQKGMEVQHPWLLKRSKRYDGRWYFFNLETKQSEWTLDASLASVPSRLKDLTPPQPMAQPKNPSSSSEGENNDKMATSDRGGLLPKVRGCSDDGEGSEAVTTPSPGGRARRPSWTEAARNSSARRNSLGELAEFYEVGGGNGGGTNAADSISPSLSSSLSGGGGPRSSVGPGPLRDSLSASQEETESDVDCTSPPMTRFRPLQVDTKTPPASSSSSNSDSGGQTTSPELHSPYTSFNFTPFRSQPGARIKSQSVSDFAEFEKSSPPPLSGKGGGGGGSGGRDGLGGGGPARHLHHHNSVGSSGGGLVGCAGGGGVGFMRHAPDLGGSMVDPKAERMRLASMSGKQEDFLKNGVGGVTSGGGGRRQTSSPFSTSYGSSFGSCGSNDRSGSGFDHSGSGLDTSGSGSFGSGGFSSPRLNPVIQEVAHYRRSSPGGGDEERRLSVSLTAGTPPTDAASDKSVRPRRRRSKTDEKSFSPPPLAAIADSPTGGGEGRKNLLGGWTRNTANPPAAEAAGASSNRNGLNGVCSPLGPTRRKSGVGGTLSSSPPLPASTTPNPRPYPLHRSGSLGSLSELQPLDSSTQSRRESHSSVVVEADKAQESVPPNAPPASTDTAAAANTEDSPLASCDSPSSPPLASPQKVPQPQSPPPPQPQPRASLLAGLLGAPQSLLKSVSEPSASKRRPSFGGGGARSKEEAQAREEVAVAAAAGSSSRQSRSSRSSKFEEKYVVTGGLGMGGYSLVVMVEDVEAGTPFAMKVTMKNRLKRSRDRKRLRNELKVMRELPESPFLERCHAAFESPTRLFFILDYNAGGDLFFHLVRRVKSTNGGFTEGECRTLLAELVLALEHLHGCGFVHRDLKVENIMLNSKGHVKLIDFGLACELKRDEEPLSPTGSLIYMAPELLKDTIGGRFTDWWAVGVLAHELLTGRTPWSSLTDKALIQREIVSMRVAPPAAVSPAAGKFVCGLLHQDRSKRLGTSDSKEVRHASFFKTIDWALAEKVGLPPALGVGKAIGITSDGGRDGGKNDGGGHGGAFDPEDCKAILEKYIQGAENEHAVTDSGGGDVEQTASDVSSLGLPTVRASPSVGLHMPGRDSRENGREDPNDDDPNDGDLYGWDDYEDGGFSRRHAAGTSSGFGGFSSSCGAEGGGGSTGGGGGWDCPPKIQAFSSFEAEGVGGIGGGGWDRPKQPLSPKEQFPVEASRRGQASEPIEW